MIMIITMVYDYIIGDLAIQKNVKVKDKKKTHSQTMLYDQMICAQIKKCISKTDCNDMF